MFYRDLQARWRSYFSNSDFLKASNCQKYFGFVVLFVFIFAAYSNVFQNEFLLDDEFLIVKNQFISSWRYFFKLLGANSTAGSGGVDSFYRPMQTIAYLVFNKIFGLHPWAFHLLNVLLHFLNASIIFIISRRLGVGNWPALVATLIWAMHPIHTEAITYMSATADPLHTFFCLVAVCLVAGETSFKMVGLATISFILGLMSKESAIVLPGLILLILFFQKKYQLNRRDLMWSLPFWVVAIVYLVMRKTWLNFDDTFHFYKTSNVYTENISVRIFTFLATIPEYFKLILWPQKLHLERSFLVYANWSTEVFAGATIVLGAIAAVWFQKTKARAFFVFAIWWVIVTHSPHSGIILPVNSFFLEHWMYLVTIGPVLYLAYRLSKLRMVYLSLPMVIAIALGICTWNQNKYWSDPIAFYNRIIELEPKPYHRVLNNLGMAYADKGDLDLAINLYRRAIDTSDTYPQTRHNLGVSLFAKRDFESAKREFLRAVEINPDFYHSVGYLAQICKIQNDMSCEKEYGDRYFQLLKRFAPWKISGD